MARRAVLLLVAVLSILAVIPSAQAGPATGKVKKSGTLTHYFLAGGAGTGIPWPEGGELDAPGDVGALGPKPGTEPHVALGNVWTTVFLEMPIAFESGPFTASTMMGGNATIVTFLSEPTAVAVVGFVEARLYEITKDGAVAQFADLTLDSEIAYTAGPTGPERGSYTFKVPQVWQIPKGNRLRIEMDFTCFCSTFLRFFYGDAAWAASLTLDKYIRVT
jgi:hypothetical protein